MGMTWSWRSRNFVANFPGVTATVYELQSIRSNLQKQSSGCVDCLGEKRPNCWQRIVRWGAWVPGDVECETEGNRHQVAMPVELYDKKPFHI